MSPKFFILVQLSVLGIIGYHKENKYNTSIEGTFLKIYSALVLCYRAEKKIKIF